MLRSSDTRERLVDAAGKIFASVGYDKASVREICRAANANISAVSYHFGDKAGLYESVVHHVMSDIIEDRKSFLSSVSESPQEVLERFVAMHADRAEKTPHRKWFKGIIMHELDSPRCKLSLEFREMNKQIEQKLQNAVSQLLPKGTPAIGIALVTESLIAQCISFFKHQRFFDVHISSTQKRSALAQIIKKHILSFSMTGMTYLCKAEDKQ